MENYIYNLPPWIFSYTTNLKLDHACICLRLNNSHNNKLALKPDYLLLCFRSSNQTIHPITGSALVTAITNLLSFQSR